MGNFIMRPLKQHDLCTFEPRQDKPYVISDLEPGDEVTLLEDERCDWEEDIGDISSKDLAGLRLKAIAAKLNEELYKQNLNHGA